VACPGEQRIGQERWLEVDACIGLLLHGSRADAYKVQKADASITEYAAARALIDNGDRAGGQGKLDAIEEYNAYDCRSTLALRDWLLALAAERGV
ncbi:hypothetical protein ACC691_38355, partial [Rhizobium johnstonii]|uniref:hypothetical protein n=1 Tax=Rhizobium johnstonii TaxID=3019933 RepID=UPI003F9CB5BA